MTDLSLQNVLGIRYRTSSDAERLTTELMGFLGLSTKANVARLAIGRSLSFGPVKNDAVDAGGKEIPANSLFSIDDVALWIGLVVTHAHSNNETIETLDDFRVAIRNHWHRGVHELMREWRACESNYNKFMEVLISRYAELPIDSDFTDPESSDESSRHIDPEALEDKSTQIENAIRSLGVNVSVVSVVHGPRVSRYKLLLNDISQLSKLRRSLDSLQVALSLESRPTLAHGDEPKTLGLEIPRSENTWQSVRFSSLKEWAALSTKSDMDLPVYLGSDAMGQPFFFDLASAPHLLVAGTTGSGKSVCLHALILSLLMTQKNDGLRLALIDPKQVEFAAYKNMKLLYGGEVVTEASKAEELLLQLVQEMESRYRIFEASGVSNISEAHTKGITVPYIVIFVEELTDLIMQNSNIESLIVRIAQKARAAGIHLVLATQRPDAKTISGLIRSNIPSRIAFRVQKETESKIILDDTGAENLLGKGDFIAKVKPGKPGERGHGVWISSTERDAFLKSIAKK